MRLSFQPFRPIACSLAKITLPVLTVAILLILAACRTEPTQNQIFIEVDGGQQTLTTTVAITVREALSQAKIELGTLDRVTPDLYAQAEPGVVIKVTRVKEEIQTRQEVVPFQRQTITNEALAPGEKRISQLGVNGEEEISIRIVFENGQEVSRTEVSRTIITQPVPEILVVGPQGELPSVPLTGTIAYLSNGNAWLMRDSSGSRRPLTTEGDLDGRAFSLSPDGRYLLYTRPLTEQVDLPLNDLWLASTTIIGEAPITTGIQGVLYAEWSPVVSPSLVAYSTAERSLNQPGWKANNDLWFFTPSAEKAGSKISKPVQVLPPNTQGLYPWWGTTFVWSPDGTKLAYARADQIGVIKLTGSNPISATMTSLIDFTPLKTFSEWVWVPGLSWSPDGKFIAAIVHGPPVGAESAEESQVFDLWLIGVDNGISAKVAEQVGMWSNPAWSPGGIAFGAAINPVQSVNSRYNLNLIDRDGSNKRQLFPFREELGVQLPELTWLPGGAALLFSYNGNLYTVNSDGTPPKQLTSDAQASHPRWVAETPAVTGTSPLTRTATLTPTVTLTPTQVITSTPASTPTITATLTFSTTPAVTPTIRLATATPRPVTPTLMPTLSITGTVTITRPNNTAPSEGTEIP